MNLSKCLDVIYVQAEAEHNIKEEYNKNVRPKVYGIFPFEQIQEFETWVNNDRPPFTLIKQRINKWKETYK